MPNHHRVQYITTRPVNCPMPVKPRPLPWLEPGAAFPPVAEAWGPGDPAPGLLAAGGALDVETLVEAYRRAIFPWFNEDQPILWWSTDPRMALRPASFRLHRSFEKTLKRFAKTPGCEVRVDTAFSAVIQHCAHAPRGSNTGSGTWIVPDMIKAYIALHQAGHAHSVETWINGELVGGLYCVALGKAVFGESMFSLRTDASKIALAGLVTLCDMQGVAMIDCQQNTSHLGSLGGQEMSRTAFANHVALASQEAPLNWGFENLYWNRLLERDTPPSCRA